VSYGSSYPSATDSFATISESTSAFTANTLNEIASAIDAVQAQLGPHPSNLTSTGLTSLGYTTDFGTVAAMLQAFIRWEIGEIVFSGSNNSTTGTFVATGGTTRFSSAPKVFLMPENFAAELNGNNTYTVGSITTTGFNAWRNQSSGNYNTGSITIKFFAIQWPA